MVILYLFPLLLSVLWMNVVSARGVINIRAEPGQNINLTCRATKNSEVTVVWLSRDEKTVFIYRNNGIDETVQHPQFKGRISLQSLSTADGEVNVTLSNVTEKDNGTYLCDVKDKENNIETFNHLHVDRQGNTDKHTEEGEIKDNSDGLKDRRRFGLIAGLVAVLIVAAVIVAVIVRKKRMTPPNETENDVGIPLRAQNTSSPS